MNLEDLEHFRDVLLERQERLIEWQNIPSSTRQHDAEIVRGLIGQIREALSRVETESYGSCNVCHGTVEKHRLEVQPVSQICLECISDEEKVALEEDLYLASKIHRALLPQSVPAIDGFEVSARSLAAGSIGGDYYDFFLGDDLRPTRIVVADVMGKGLPAGLLMSNLQGALRILSSEIDSPRPLLERLNTWLCRNVPVTKFVSLICLKVKNSGLDSATLAYTNAGHCPPILIRNDGSAERLAVTGGVLGVHEDFEYEERSLDLHSGDLLLVHTDGVIEAESVSGEQFEDDRVIDFLKTHRTDPVRSILEDLIGEVLAFTGSPDVSDDLTAILLRKK